MSVETPSRLVLCSEELLATWGTRNERGDLITAEWGEPDENGWYAPRFTVHSDNNLVTDTYEKGVKAGGYAALAAFRRRVLRDYGTTINMGELLHELELEMNGRPSR